MIRVFPLQELWKELEDSVKDRDSDRCRFLLNLIEKDGVQKTCYHCDEGIESMPCTCMEED